MKTQTSTKKPYLSSNLTPRIAVLAIDGLDWQLLQQLVDSGQMPFCNQLLDAGSSATMTVPAPHSTADYWSTVATGVIADQHGVCHDLSVQLRPYSHSVTLLQINPLMLYIISHGHWHMSTVATWRQHNMISGEH